MTQPLELPPGFNPETSMIAREVDGAQFHAPIPAIVLAYNLVENGTPQDLEQAEKTIRAVLDCQEKRIGSPHRGNFLWEGEDEVVEDLNAVQFILFNLIPIAPLDGSAVVGSFVPAYGAFLRNPANAKYTWAAFGLVFLLAGELFGVGADLASSYVRWVVGA